MGKKLHKLHIISLHDTQAECICKRWCMICTGERKKQEIREEFEKHLKHEHNYRRRHKNIATIN